jgi:hypothetical protein
MGAIASAVTSPNLRMPSTQKLPRERAVEKMFETRQIVTRKNAIVDDFPNLNLL